MEGRHGTDGSICSKTMEGVRQEIMTEVDKLSMTCQQSCVAVSGLPPGVCVIRVHVQLSVG